jgi:hypothetical protein
MSFFLFDSVSIGSELFKLIIIKLHPKFNKAKIVRDSMS